MSIGISVNAKVAHWNRKLPQLEKQHSMVTTAISVTTHERHAQIVEGTFKLSVNHYGSNDSQSVAVRL